MDRAVSQIESRRSELRRRLGAVNDPELDEPVVEMGFVERADIRDDGFVDVDFRLPTYWCSPNFAFLMLDDLRRALDGLSWRPAYRLRLHDHMFSDEVNAGVAAGRAFEEIFGKLAQGEPLEEVRAKFRTKAFQRRQEAVLVDLRARRSDEEIVAMDVAALEVEAGSSPVFARYLEALILRFPDPAPTDPAFRTLEGAALDAAGLGAHLAGLRAVRINMEFNGALCRGLKGTRYKEMEMVDGEPTLVDFVLDRVPPRGDVVPPARS